MPQAAAINQTESQTQRPALTLALLWWLAPVAFLLWLYRDGLKVWFLADDFAWLSLLRQTHNFHDLLIALFQPQAQGTIRPWSDRGFFLLFESLFGLDSLPMRVCVFVTMGANVALIAWIARRITGSPIAGFLAPVFWTANAALIDVMSWNSAYDEALCTLFLLAALVLFIHWDDTGRPKFWWWQLVVFVLGFGALELNIVYPALAASYALFVAAPERRRRLLLGLTPLFGISVLYFLLHRLAVRFPDTGPYAIHFDARIPATFGRYWHWMFVPKAWLNTAHFDRLEKVSFWVITVLLASFFVREVARRRFVALFFVSWFLISLTPMLPLPAHLTDYYLTIPSIGIAILAAWGIERAWAHGWTARFAVVALTIAYLIPMVEACRGGVDWWVDRSREARGLTLGVAAARATHPDKAIVLNGMTSFLYNEIISQAAFYTLGVDNVYLTPGSSGQIQPTERPDLLDKWVLDPAIMVHAITHDEVVVYSFLGDHLRNITSEWVRKALGSAQDQEPRRVEASSPLSAYLLGPEWYPLEPGIRWMPRRATLRLAGPRSANDRLFVQGYCPEQQLKAGPLHLSVSVDGIPLKNAQIDNPETDFQRLFDIPRSLAGRPVVEVAITVDKVFHDAGGRELGLVFGTVAIR